MRSFIAWTICWLVVLVSTGGPLAAADWLSFLGPTANGKSTETGILTDWSDGKLKLLWTLDLDTSYGIGAVDQGRYFQFDRVGDVERLICLDAASGREIWHADQPVAYRDMYGYNNGPRSSPVIAGNRVFTYGVAGRLSCFDKTDGKLLWTHSLNEEFGVIQNFFGVSCCPVIYKDMVIVMVGGSPAADQRLPLGALDRVIGNNSGIVAFRQSDGKLAYQVSDELASYSTPVIAKIDGQDVGLAFMRGGLLAFDPNKGEELWHFPWRSPRLESVNAALPIVRGDQVLISECYDVGSALLKVTPRDYELLWKDPRSRRAQAMRAHWATPIQHGDYLFGCSGRNEPDSDLRCIRWSDGEVMWTKPNRIRTSLLWIDGHFVVLDERGHMELIKDSSDSYQPVTEIDLSEALGDIEAPFLRSPCWAAPVVANGRLYVRGANRVACFQLIPSAAK